MLSQRKEVSLFQIDSVADLIKLIPEECWDEATFEPSFYSGDPWTVEWYEEIDESGQP